MLPEQIYEKANESVVTIITYDFNGNQLGSGSGVVISDDGRIVSNSHVFEDCENFEIRKGGITISDVEVLDQYSEYDLILLKIKPGIFKPLKFSKPEDVKIGKNVFSVGNPLGLFENTIAEGIISGLRNLYSNEMTYIQFTAPISGGNSGGALLNDNCELVGITSMSRKNANDIHFAIPANEITNIFTEDKLHFNGAAKYYLLASNALATANYTKSAEYFENSQNLLRIYSLPIQVKHLLTSILKNMNLQ